MPKRATSAKNSYHHGDLKQALLDETARILREEGESALSLRRLAANLGVSRTAPYNHFKSKEMLLSAVAEEGFRRYAQVMRRVRHKHRNSDGKKALRATVQAYLDFALEHQEYYDLMYGSKSWQSGQTSGSLASTARLTLRMEIERLQRAQDQGLVASDLDVADFSRILWGTLHGISRLSLDGVYSDPVSLKRLCNKTADMLWQQLDPSQ